MNSTPPEKRQRRAQRVPADSFFYNRLFPILLIALVAITAILVIIASGILLGIIPYR